MFTYEMSRMALYRKAMFINSGRDSLLQRLLFS